MAVTPEQLQEKMDRRKLAVMRSTNSKFLSARGCEKTGAGVVVVQSIYTDEVTAHFFRPRQINRAFAYRSLKTAHERMAALSTLQAMIQTEKDAKKAPHTLKVGDIIASTWGATMQRVRFYRVTSIPHPQKVEVVSAGVHMASGNWDNGTAVPENINGPISEDVQRAVFKVSMESGEPVVATGSSTDRGRLWNGNPVHVYCD